MGAPAPGLDRIALTGLTVFGRHGVFEHERRDGQDFVVDVVLHVDISPAAATDDLHQTVDYGVLAQDVAAVVGGDPVDLIETLAQRIAEVALHREFVQAVEVTVHKPHAPVRLTFQDVSVHVHRARPSGTGDPDHPSRQPTTAVLALGTNQGEREQLLADAVQAVAALPRVTVLAVSPVVETAAVGGPPQPDYLNAVLLLQTTQSARCLLAGCHGIESAAGRRRSERWGPRTLDLDLIRYGDLRCADPDLTVPHPRAAQRAFVLAPWSLLDPQATLLQPSAGPAAGWAEVAVHDLLAVAADRDQVRVRADLSLPLPVSPRSEA